ncbi:Chromatin assembly factor 1 subunit [Tieghemiomyces parasiticus]|uniref:Chromatin assembly factor 1 subunit n=1 Tax=Tieghemiomyces parasiticus TaxID=78921 RepID=A0A9W7ZZJ4_9FUNG|nr:Chromatin assembly factor 1 subunit [Tieghemiomyces parasiticus]
MKAKTFQINWHDKLAVFAADFDPSSSGRFATAGGDSNVRIWRLNASASGAVTVDFTANLSRHSAAVNVVRFSPRDSLLASSGDDGTIIVWKQSQAMEGNLERREEDEFASETWKVVSLLRGSLADIYDLSWSADGRFIISGSVDNTARIWDVKQAKCLHCVADHSHYVQGVTWDPLGQYFATQSSDRSVNIYQWMVRSANSTKKALAAKHARIEVEGTSPAVSVSKEPVAGGDGSITSVAPAPSYQRLYHSENLTSFFRRPCFTPDGSLLLTPAGIRKPVDVAKGMETVGDAAPGSATVKDDALEHTVYMYARDQLAGVPVGCLSGFGKPAIAVRCAPQRFHLRRVVPTAWLALPYRMVIAVATQDAVLLYDTEQTEPFAYLANFHYATLTDIAWSPDCRYLILTSTDGYCSVITFDAGELGEEYKVAVTATTNSGVSLGGMATQEPEPVVLLAPKSPHSESQPPVVAPSVAVVRTGPTNKSGKKRIQPTLIQPL